MKKFYILDVIPPSIFQHIIEDKLLPQLEYGCWRVEPEGLHSALDWMDNCVDITPSIPRKRFTTKIICVTYYDIEDDLRRYNTRHSAYRDAGLKVDIEDRDGTRF